MAKLPAFQFYTGDWLKDPELSMCSPSTRGIWIDLLCAMHEMDRSGQITGTTEQLARLCRCTAVNFVQALEELKATNTATVTERNGKVTVINRRMKREDRERKSRNERALRYRQKMKRESNAESDGERNAKVTCISSSSSSSSKKENNNIKEKITFSLQSGGFENITSEDILAWSEAYPAVDVQLSIKQAAQWLISNPSKLKKNYRRFLTNWFARTQEKGGNKHAPKSDPNYRPRISEQDWGQELLLSGKNEMQMRKTTQGDHPDGTGLPGGAVCSVRRQTARSGGTTGIASDSEGEGRADAAGFGAGNTAAVCFRTPAGLEQNVQTNIARF